VGFKNRFIVGLANGEIRCIPTREAFMKSGYESIFTKFTEEAGERIRDAALELIERIAHTRESC